MSIVVPAVVMAHTTDAITGTDHRRSTYLSVTILALLQIAV